MSRLYSFVLPAYKASFIKEAIDSILAQTYTNFELIIVNDASPEDIDSIVKSYDDCRIQYYVNTVNIGGEDLVAQWNRCLRYAKGEYVILASDDDIYHSEYLSKMNSLVEKYPFVNIFRPRVQHIDRNNNIIRVESVMKEYVTNSEYLYFWLKNWITRGIPFWVCKREALLYAGGYSYYPLGWYSDDDMVLKLAGSGVVFCDDILFSFRMSNVNISSSYNNYKSLKSKLSAITKFYDFLYVYKDTKLNSNEEYVKYIQKVIVETININWVNNEIIGLLLTASFVDLLKMTGVLISCESFRIIDFVKLYCKYMKRLIHKTFL